MKTYYRRYVLNTNPNVYEPAEDSILLADNLKVFLRDYVLDMGTGTGIQAITASEKASKVLAVDINPEAVETAKLNAIENKIENIEFRISNLFKEIKPTEKFNLIIFNPPYLPVKPEEDVISLSWAGGYMGREIIYQFIKQASNHLKHNGRIQLLVSSINNPNIIMKKFSDSGFQAEIQARKKIWFEELYIIYAKKTTRKKII